MPVRDFYGKLDDKTIYDFVKKLDYSLSTEEERINKVKELLYTDRGENDVYIDKYFQTLFEQEKNPEESHYNPHITQDDFLSGDKNVFKMLGLITSYIINSPNSKPLTKEVEYNFYSEKEYRKKFYRHEKSLNELVNKHNEQVNLSDSYIIDYIRSDEENFKKEKKQKIYKSDFKDTDFFTVIKYKNEDGIQAACNGNILEIYSDIIEFYGSKLDELKIKNRLTNYKDKEIQDQIKKIKKFLKEVKWDQLYCKDQIKGVIYFKSPMKDDGQIDYQLFNFTDKKHVSALLRCKPRDLTSDVGILIYDLEKLIEDCNFSEDDSKALDMYRDSDTNYREIGEELSITNGAAHQKVDRIINQIIKAYFKKYEDWLYLNYLKGDYKKCSMCGEVKLTKYFHWDSTNQCYKSQCKMCIKKEKNA